MILLHRCARAVLWSALAPPLLWAWTSSAMAQNTVACAPVIARVVSIEGTVEIQRAGRGDWQTANASAVPLCGGDRVHVGARSRAAVAMQPETNIRLDQFTTVTLTAKPDETVVELYPDDRVAPGARGQSCGAGYFTSRFPRRFRVLTPFVNATVEGTEFEVTNACTSSRVSVFEGTVLAEAGGTNARLQRGQSVGSVEGGLEGVTIAARPADAVAWAIYYPRLTDRSAAPTEDCSTSGAAERARCAVGQAEALLDVGRVADASAVLDEVDESAEVNALRAIIAVARNDRDRGLVLAQRAFEQDRSSLRALLSLSFAEQSRFDLDAALASARRAASTHPQSALAEARVAELLLSVGKSAEAEAAAQSAIATNADEPRGHLVAGFAQLARTRIAAARASFERAIALSPGDPLPRLGLGLAQIREGRLTEGREQFEVAVALDPVNPLVRSYMGKAYFDERDPARVALAGVQFDIAKALDPRDPTPWFYDAIRKQTINQPGDALMDLTRSVELNDNRAVYRSRFLLDQDQSARAASQSRISNELGFDQLSQAQSSRAISFDPGGFPAHRNLADSYLLQPRYESARVSELLQSQMLQPVTAVPASPRLGGVRAPVLENEGPYTPSFQEFNPLMERNRTAFYLTGFMGNEGTIGDEAMAAFVRGRHGLRLGQYFMETDGFRPNADFRQNIRNVFYQFDVDDRNSFQAEYRYSALASGDVRQNFDQNQYDTSLRQDLRSEMYRAGFRHSENATAHWLATLTRQRNDSLATNYLVTPTNIVFPPGFENLYESKRIHNDTDAYTGEIQHLRELSRVQITAGAGGTRVDENRDQTGALGFVGDPVPPLPVAAPLKTTPEYYNAYGYLGWRVAPGLQVVTALSWDRFEDLAVSKRQFNPKLGLVWNITDSTTLRAATIRALKRPFAAAQTLEPTQVAGFNQIFDDVSGTESTRMGVALDQRFGERWFAGVEASGRNLDVPVSNLDGTLARIEQREEQLYRAFVSGLVTRQLGVSAEYSFDDQRRMIPADGVGDSFPNRVTTQMLPLRATLFLGNGVFVRTSFTFVDQSVDTPNGDGTLARERHRFGLTDLMLGYRWPGGRGILSLEARNLFDRQFGFQDTDFAGIPRIPLFRPGQSLILRATFQY
ncbi:MAG: TonB-dependent receptor [Burkholderiales bacterium]|nr:TonB-dependent receptor [Burkholderiales bacterium]